MSLSNIDSGTGGGNFDCALARWCASFSAIESLLGGVSKGTRGSRLGRGAGRGRAELGRESEREGRGGRAGMSMGGRKEELPEERGKCDEWAVEDPESLRRSERVAIRSGEEGC